METCVWCNTSELEAEDALCKLLQRYSIPSLSKEEVQAADDDLVFCPECVVEYHKAREKSPQLHKRLWELETERLQGVFRPMLELELEDEDILIVVGDQEKPLLKFSPAEFHNRLRFPLMEVLKYPYLLCHPSLCDMVVQVLCKMEDMAIPLQVFDKYQGIYLLMVHPNEKVRKWAINVARSLGKVDRDHFYDLEDIFTSMFYVIELGISLNIPDMDDSYHPEHKMLTLPRHLYDSSNEKNYWLGICMLLMQLDSQAMDSLFTGLDRQVNIPQCILNTMDEPREEGDPASDPFWPALHCFMVILDRLGSKIWAQIEPAPAFHTITGAASYTSEIESIRHKTTVSSRVKVETDMVTCSQMVYDFYAAEKKKKITGQSSRGGDSSSSSSVIFEEMNSLVSVLQSEMGQNMRVYGSTFLWFIPFVKSVMELAELSVIYISEVVHFLCGEISRDVLAGRTSTCDKVTEFFTRILVEIIELHVTKGRMGILYYCAPKWVEVVVLCASLSSDSVGAVDGGLGVSSTSSLRCGVRTPTVGIEISTMTQACMKLIRSLLKEGVRLGSELSVATFLNLLNKQLREIPPKGLSLPSSKVKELQQLLRQLVKMMADKSMTPSTDRSSSPTAQPAPPTASPTSPTTPHTIPTEISTTMVDAATTTFTYPFHDDEQGPSNSKYKARIIKEEPLWSYGKHSPKKDDFSDHREEVLKVKKEPESPLPISKMRTDLELQHIKPDLEKFKNIQSKLNKKQNLSKIQDIAKRETNVVSSSEQSKQYCHISKSNQPVCLQSPIQQPTSIKPTQPVSSSDEDDDEPLHILGKKRLKKTCDLESDNLPVEDSRQVSNTFSCKGLKKDPEAGIIVISDDEESISDGVSAMKDNVMDSKGAPQEIQGLVDTSGLDYNGDLSESQVFEFETQEFVPSTWGDFTSKCSARPKADEEAQTMPRKGPAEHQSSWGYETDPVPDEDIERACLRVEQQIKRQQSADSLVPPNHGVPEEEQNQSVKPQLLAMKSPHGENLQETKIPTIIEAKVQKSTRSPQVPKTSRQMTKAPSATTARFCPPLPSPSSVTPSFALPVIVPPKKVRKRIEPESTVERLGLKKKERKAFQLSQRSLDSVDELRRYGKSVNLEKLQKAKRVRRTQKSSKLLSPQRLKCKGNRKLLASQDLQFFRQSRGKMQKSTAKVVCDLASRTTRDPKAFVLEKCERDEVEKDEEEDDCFDFLPCSQPDPDRRAEAVESTKINELGEPSNQARDDGVTCGEKMLDSLQTNQGANEVPVSTINKEGIIETEDDEDEWMYLTQTGATDMELCSQMEEVEEEEIFLTQLDPVDMEIDPESESDAAEEGTWVAPQPLSPHAVQKALPAGKSTDEQLFLKSGMSPMSQKKAKPSTTKIYAPTSRSATLALEMERPTKPPPPPSVVKSKSLHPSMPPPLQPPKRAQQAEFRQPLPPKSKPPLHTPKAIPSTSNNTTFHPPTYKTYSRPEAPVVKPVPSPYPCQTLDLLYLTKAILKWNLGMFNSYKQFRTTSDLWPDPLKEVPTVFSTFNEYFNTMYPLLLTNTFEEMANEWLKGVKLVYNLQVKGIEYSGNIASASFVVTLPHQALSQPCPREDDFVILWLPRNDGAYASDHPDLLEPCPHFGCVSRASVHDMGRGQRPVLNLTVQTMGNVSSVNSQPVRCEVICSLISTFRTFRGLCALKNGIMNAPILSAHPSFFQPSYPDIPDLKVPMNNTDQMRAICCGVSIVRRQQQRKTPRILLLHGPPGTGKSKTIVGLLQCLLPTGRENVAPRSRQGKGRQLRVLLCAPSNAAIDSLMKKVIVDFKETCQDKQNPRGNCGDINLVRLGNEKTISKELTPFSLDNRIKARTKRVQQSAEADINRQKQQLDQNIESLSQQCAKAKRGTTEFQQLTEKKCSLLKERATLSRQLNESRERKQDSVSKVLQDAQVICCTLSCSGSVLLESAFRRLGQEPFSCVIVDEAGQATEMETLIPLKHCCPTLILVGDPDQLPPTVISKTAKELGYDQSLMARLCKKLRQSSVQPSPIVFLSTQYRMHPDICEFPSKYIYHKALKNDSETAQKRCAVSWPFHPYRVFDVTDGREHRERETFSNPTEVKLVILLLKLIGERNVVCEQPIAKVGVITPYNGQKQRIQTAIKELRPDDNHIQVDVDTVDGFQGREMDCIIVSCVRASSEMGSIGFLGSRQRMNVTITRAKYSLFILGHLRTLREQHDWGALVEDAGKRGTIIKTRDQDFLSDIRKIFKPELLCRGLSHPTPALSSCSVSGGTTSFAPLRGHRLSYLGPGHAPATKESRRTPPPAHRDGPQDPRLAARPQEPPPIPHRSESRMTPPSDRRDHPRDPRLVGKSADPSSSRHAPRLSSTSRPQPFRDQRLEDGSRGHRDPRERTHREADQSAAGPRGPGCISHLDPKRPHDRHLSSYSSSPKRSKK